MTRLRQEADPSARTMHLHCIRILSSPGGMLQLEHSPWLNQASGALLLEVVAAHNRDFDVPVQDVQCSLVGGLPESWEAEVGTAPMHVPSCDSGTQYHPVGSSFKLVAFTWTTSRRWVVVTTSQARQAGPTGVVALHPLRHARLDPYMYI
jgi:hypothetical protein